MLFFKKKEKKTEYKRERERERNFLLATSLEFPNSAHTSYYILNEKKKKGGSQLCHEKKWGIDNDTIEIHSIDNFFYSINSMKWFNLKYLLNNKLSDVVQGPYKTWV